MKLSRHFEGGAANLGAASKLGRGGGEAEFAGAMGGEETKVEDSALEPPFPEGIEDNDGLEG